MNWSLPESVEIAGVEYPIRTDYRCILDILTDLSDPETDGQGRALAILIGLYPDFDDIPPEHWEEAVQTGIRFINCDGEEAPHRAPKLVEWEQDYPLIISPVNRVLGQDARSLKHLHWWTFLSAYQEIGDCTFAQVVRIRDRLRRGQPLDRSDRAWYQKNRHLVDFKRKYTSADEALMKEWGGG